MLVTFMRKKRINENAKLHLVFLFTKMVNSFRASLYIHLQGNYIVIKIGIHREHSKEMEQNAMG